MSCTSCWSLCVCVKRVISAGEVFCHELPFSAYFLQEKDLGLEPLQSCWDEAQDHSTFFILSGTCDREVLLHAQPILDNLGHFWRNLFFCYEDTWLTVLAPNCDKTSPFLTLEGCGICLPCLSGCYWPAWIGHAGLQSHERWKKLLSSLNVQLRLHILIVPLPKIQPTFLLEEPWQQLALLAGLSSSLVAALYWSSIGRTNCTIFSSVAMKMIWFLAHFLSAGLNLWQQMGRKVQIADVCVLSWLTFYHKVVA